MTEINLNELERLAKGITPGPWSVKDDWHLYIMDATGKRELAKISNKYRAKDVNAAYIAAACNAAPELIAENRALRERVQWLEDQNADLCNQLRRAMSHDNNSLSAFLNDAIECASHRP